MLHQLENGRASKPFDATTRDLLEFQPIDWLRYTGLEATEVEVINSDLSPVTTEADKILRVIRPNPWLSHLELQSDYEFDVPDRALRYNVLCCYRRRLPVQSTVVLLRPQADGPNMTGELLYRLPGQEPYLRFEYGVVRVWQKPVEEVLAGGLGTLPLAPLSDVKQDDLPRVVRRIEERITQEATAQEGARLWAATYVLMGLRYPRGLAGSLLQGVRAMRESVTYQAIIEEGEFKEARRMVVRIGSKRFGPPDAITRTSIESVPTLEQLEEMADRVLDVTSWTDLLKGLS